MALTFDGTNFETTYSFYVKRSPTFNTGEPRLVTIGPIPGREGLVYGNLEKGIRNITVNGYLIGTSKSDAETKLKNMDGKLHVASGSFGTAPASDLTPTRITKTLKITELFETIEFDDVVFQKMNVTWVEPGSDSKVLDVALSFVQLIPYSTAVV